MDGERGAWPEDEEVLVGVGWLPRWLPWLIGAGVAVLAGALIGAKIANAPIDPSAPSSSAPPTSRFSGPVGPPLVTLANATRIPVPGGGPADDVVTTGVRTYVLSGDRLVQLHGVRPRHEARVYSYGLNATTLVLDAKSGQLWVVVPGVPRSTVQLFDAATLQMLGAVRWPRAIEAAAALRGELYLADPAGLFRVDVRGSVTPIAIPQGQDILSLAADPSRSRVLMLVAEDGGASITEVGMNGPRVSQPAPDHMGKGALGVTGDGSIWVAGYGGDGAVLVRLDPVSFRAVAVSSVADQLGPGAVLLASGMHSLLVADGGGLSRVFCITAADGAPAERWTLGATRASSVLGVTYATGPDGLYRLDVAGPCTG